MWRGPARLRVATKGGSFAVNFPLAAIEAEQEDPVESQVGYRDESAARIEHCLVRMRALACRTRSGPGSPFRSTRSLRGPSVPSFLDRHHADRAGAVIGGNDPAAARIDRQMHRVLATTGLPVERSSAGPATARTA